MRSFGCLLAAGLVSATAVGAAAQSLDDEIQFRPYFGVAYERGSVKFKTATLYGEDIAGYAPLVGVSAGKYFAVEASWRKAYGDGPSQASTPADTTVTTATDTILTKYTTTYHSSSNAFALDLIVRWPLGHTGLAPFVLTGVTIDKLKEVSRVDAAITTTTLGTTDAKSSSDATYTTLIGRTEVSPEIGLGLAYGYGGGELRVLGRIQNANMNNSGQYLLTFSAGLLLHL